MTAVPDEDLDYDRIGCGLLGCIDDDYGSPIGGTSVYRFFDVDSDLLYVGTSRDFGQRWKDHAASKPWWGDIHHMSIVWYRDDEAAEAVERHAIQTERPRYNVTHNPFVSRATGPRARGLVRTPEADKARAVYRRSVRLGRPLTQRALAAKFPGRSRNWAKARIREAESGPRLAKAQGA